MPNLEMQVNKMQVGLYTVTYGYKRALFGAQEETFAANGLNPISPAQFGFLRAQPNNSPFLIYSETSADVFYDNRTDRIVIVPDGSISKQVGIANVVATHSHGQGYVVPQSQRELVYAMVDEMLRKGTAFTSKHGQTDIIASEFGQTELTSKLFSDGRLGIKAQNYGDWLAQQGRSIQSIFFDNEGYAKSQKGPYVDKLRVFGDVLGFLVNGLSSFLDYSDGA